MAEYALQLKAVHQSFGTTPVLQGVDLCVRSGERIALIGPNGAGKSTLFDLISGRFALGAPGALGSGDILLAGQSIRGKPPFAIYRQGLARSFQTNSVFPTLSVLQNLRCAVFFGLGYRWYRCNFWRPLHRNQDVQARVDQLLQALGLTARREVLAMHLTYAEGRTLEIGLTLASRAPVILLDEPSAGMNPGDTERLIECIHTLTQGKTLLIIEHDLRVVEGLADRVAVLASGKIMALDTPSALRTNAAVQAAYFGSVGSTSDDRMPCTNG